MVSQERLKELMKYDPDTGLFARISKCCGVSIKASVGNVMKKSGYLRVKIDGKLYMAHRFAWLYIYGSFHDGEIDHINGIRLDNRINNLRAVSKNENLLNKRVYANSSSGITGVHWHKQHRKWCAAISINGRRKHLGLFNNIKDAELARKEANSKFGFHVNHGNRVTI